MFALFVAILSPLAVVLSGPLLAAEAQLLWANNGTTHEIMIAHYNDQQWTDAESIYQSDNPLTSVAMATDLDGGKIVVFSEILKTRTVLMKMQMHPQSLAWSNAELFVDFGKENFAASLVTDASNTVWLFWSANNGDLDDIYFIRRTSSGWSVPQRVNEKNEVPDIKPHARINHNGEVEVEWQTYSMLLRSYQGAHSVLITESSKTEADKTVLKPEISLSEIRLPAIVKKQLSSLIHFPSNILVQSIRLESASN